MLIYTKSRWIEDRRESGGEGGEGPRECWRTGCAVLSVVLNEVRGSRGWRREKMCLVSFGLTVGAMSSVRGGGEAAEFALRQR